MTVGEAAKKEFKLTPAESKDLLSTVIGIAWWQKLGAKYGFKWNTAESAPGKGPEYFRAEPTPKVKP